MTTRHNFTPILSMTEQPGGGYLVRLDFIDSWEESTTIADDVDELDPEDPRVMAACDALDVWIAAQPGAVPNEHRADGMAGVIEFTIGAPVRPVERFHVAQCIRRALRHPRIAAAGAREFRDSCGMTYDNDPTSPRSEAYDAARELAHIVTRRRYDDAA